MVINVSAFAKAPARQVMLVARSWWNAINGSENDQIIIGRCGRGEGGTVERREREVVEVEKRMGLYWPPKRVRHLIGYGL
jgi:hypothetical protein